MFFLREHISKKVCEIHIWIKGLQNKKAAAFPLSVQPIPSFRKADFFFPTLGKKKKEHHKAVNSRSHRDVSSSCSTPSSLRWHCASHSLSSQQPPWEAKHVSVMVCLELKPGVAPGSCSCFCQSESSPSGKGGRGLQRGCWLFSDKGKQTEVLLFQYDRYPNTLSLKARQTTAFWCPLYSLLISPVSTHHSLAKLSEEAGTEWEKRKERDCVTFQDFFF